MAEGDFNFQEWLKKAKEDPKQAAPPFVIVFALIFFAYKFVYLPKTLTLRKELAKNKGVQDQIRDLESAVANIEDLKTEVGDLRKSWTAIEDGCYKKSESPIFLQDLRKLGKLADLNFKSITPQPLVPKTYETLNYWLFPVKIGFTGTFKQLGIFSRILAKHAKLVFLDLPTLVPDASGAFKLDLFPTAILIEERAPPPSSEEGSGE